MFCNHHGFWQKILSDLSSKYCETTILNVYWTKRSNIVHSSKLSKNQFPLILAAILNFGEKYEESLSQTDQDIVILSEFCTHAIKQMHTFKLKEIYLFWPQLWDICSKI